MWVFVHVSAIHAIARTHTSRSITHIHIHSQSVNRIRPSNDLFASVSVGEGSEAVVVFDEGAFKFPPIASKFKMIICSTSLI
ncbi:hypothetical protein EON63_11445 [archaeon]|nr:MAG: hypothetical protein EON63_11445 [archaeon]